MKRLIAAVFVLALCASAFAGNVLVSSFSVVEDSANSATWRIGGAASRTDFDTSVTYDARYWDNLTLEVKGVPVAATSSADSGASTIILQMSNDQIYWTPIDSALAVDSLAFFKNCTLQHYQYARFVGHWATKSDSAGVNVTITALARGLK